MTMTCQDLVELVTDYLEGSMDPDDRRRFEDHIAGCPGCVAYLEQIRDVVRRAGELQGDDLSPAARHALMEAFNHWRSET